MKQPTGVQMLDHLLEGGLPQKSLSLIYGPSFIGKGVLAHQMVLSNLKQGLPVVLVLTKATAADARKQLQAMDGDLPDYEKKGLLRYVDTFSRSIEAEEEDHNVVYTDTAADLNGIAVALNQCQADIVKVHDDHLVVLDSVSTLILHNNATTVFRFLQILTGKARRAGATTVMLLDTGMHEESAVQMLKHLCDGVFILRQHQENIQIRIEGLGVEENPGWLDYRFTAKQFEVTSSLAGGRIR